MSTISCAVCDALKERQTDPCPVCGSLNSNVTVALTGQQIICSQGNVGTVADQWSEDGHSIVVRTPEGAMSHSVADANRGEYSISGARMGRRGDKRVVDLLASVLSAQANNLEILAARDCRGEDGKFRILGVDYIVQVVTVPMDSELWNAAAVGSTKFEQSRRDAIASVREAIMHKFHRTDPASRQNTIIAIDAVHFGTLVDVIDGYLTEHGGPAEEFAIASVWIVGPADANLARVGAGRP